MHFNLYNEFLLIKGENEYKIIDLYSGKEDLITKNQFNILNDLKSESIEFLNEKYSNTDVYELVKKFESEDYGFITESKASTKTFETVDMKLQNFSRLIKFNLDRAYLELDGECDLNCSFCDDEQFDFRLCGCKRWKEDDKLDISRWNELVEELSWLGVKEIFICGGNPFKNWDRTYLILKEIFKLGIKINIFTNGMNISKDIATKLKEFNASLFIQILSNKEDVHDKLTNVQGSFNELIRSIENLNTIGIDYRYMVLVNKLNENNIEEINSFCKDKPVEVQSIYPPNNYSPVNKTLLYDESNRQCKVHLYNYQFLQEKNQCLNKSITISSSGNVYPCTMMRDFKLGNVRSEKLYKIFQHSDYKKFWHLSKSKITGCKSCSNRIGCFDCRALEYYTNKNLYGMKFCRKVK